MFKFIAFLALLSAASAIPNPSPDLAPRACRTDSPTSRTIAPAAVDVMEASSPELASTGQRFRIESAGNPIANTKITALTFVVPSGATGCLLRAHNLPVVPGHTGAEVWTTSPWPPNSPPTWNNRPGKGEMVGPANLPTYYAEEGGLQEIAVRSCSTTMSFLVEFAEPPRSEGSLEFYNTAGTGSKDAVGFDMTFNC